LLVEGQIVGGIAQGVGQALLEQALYDDEGQILTGSFLDPHYDLERETVQLVYVWRIFPPFGSLQLAYQEGPSRISDETGKYRTIFTKLSWVF
ncbi:MAG: molybdopterin-dependent oxidoreductase, partial [Candidatus Thermoplasmatota archaeon]|nr:molybdopterin-dependent oxidoreductase [Candidatus Thermoplasmatota archaeon]